MTHDPDEITVIAATNAPNGRITITLPVDKEVVERWIEERRRGLKLRDERAKWEDDEEISQD